MRTALSRMSRAVLVPALLAINLALVVALALQTVPARPMSFQRDAYYSAFLIGDEAALEPVTAVRWTAGTLGVALLLGLGFQLRTISRPHKLAPMPVTRTATSFVVGTETERFDLHQRTQHILLISSVGVLALTGIPQAAPDWAFSGALLQGFGGIHGARSAHRVAATVLDFAVFYHLGYLLLRAALVTRRIPTALLPAVVASRLRGAGNRADVPGHGKPADSQFTPGQKLDYWVAVCCLPVMSLSGLVLAHADLAQQWLWPSAVGVGVAVHRSVALLFVAYVLSMHFSRVIWAPGVFPVNTAMFTGRLRVRESDPEAVATMEEHRTPRTPDLVRREA